MPSIVPERLKQLRANKGYNQRDLAELLDVPAGTVGMWESGKRNPKIEAIENMACIFGCNVDYITGKSDFLVSRESIENVLGRFSPKQLELFNKLASLPVDELEKTLEEIIFKMDEEQ